MLRRALFTLLAASLASACGEPGPYDREVELGMQQHFPERSLLPAASGPRLAFTNSGSDTLSFLDATTYAPIAEIPVGFLPIEQEGPHHLQASADGAFLYVGISNYVERKAAATGPHGSHGTGTADGYLLKIDAKSGHEVGRRRVSRSPGDVRFNRDRTLIFQSHFDLASVVRGVMDMTPPSEWDSWLVGTDPLTMEKRVEIRICPAGHGVGFSPDGATAYVACWYSDQLAIVDLAGQTVQRLILGDDAGAPPVPRYQPYALAVSPDGRVFISATGAGKKLILVYRPGDQAIDPGLTINLPQGTLGSPQFGSFTQDGARFYVVTQFPPPEPESRLLVIDPASLAVVENIDLYALGCLNPHAVQLSPDDAQAHLWVVCEGDRVAVRGTFHVLDRATFQEIAETPLGIFPDDVAYLP